MIKKISKIILISNISDIEKLQLLSIVRKPQTIQKLKHVCSDELLFKMITKYASVSAYGVGAWIYDGKTYPMAAREQHEIFCFSHCFDLETFNKLIAELIKIEVDKLGFFSSKKNISLLKSISGLSSLESEEFLSRLKHALRTIDNESIISSLKNIIKQSSASDIIYDEIVNSYNIKLSEAFIRMGAIQVKNNSDELVAAVDVLNRDKYNQIINYIMNGSATQKRVYIEQIRKDSKEDPISISIDMDMFLESFDKAKRSQRVSKI